MFHDTSPIGPIKMYNKQARSTTPIRMKSNEASNFSNPTNFFSCKSALKAITLGVFAAASIYAPASASPWEKVSEYGCGGISCPVYVNSSSFKRSGGIASAIIEMSSLNNAGQPITTRYQYVADCINWRTKNPNGVWQSVPRSTPGDDLNAFLCSQNRINSAVNIKIQSPSLSDRIIESVILKRLGY